MKWIDCILNYLVTIFYPQDGRKENEYAHLQEEKEYHLTLPDTPLFHVLNSILESVQIYMIEPFLHSLQRMSLENSNIEIVFFWKPFLLRMFRKVFSSYQVFKKWFKSRFYHALDRRGLTIIVENSELERAYELIHTKFLFYYFCIHKDFTLKTQPLNVEQREVQNELDVKHEEAFEFWTFHELMFRKVYLLCQEIGYLQEWILLIALESNQIDMFLLWKKWSKRKEKLKQALFNNFFEHHHIFVNQIWKKCAYYFGLKELKPYEFYVIDYSFKLEKDIKMLGQKQLNWNSDWIQRKNNLIENEIQFLLHLQTNFYHYIRLPHHPKLLVILGKNSDIKSQISFYVLCKEHIRMCKKKLYNCLLWYLDQINEQQILYDFYEIWNETYLELEGLNEQLEISFQKQIKTEENKQKDIQTRIIQTLKNKIVRKSVQGHFFDQTMDLEEFVKHYQKKKGFISQKFTELNNLILFYEQSKNKLTQTTISDRIRNTNIIENFF